MKSIIFTTLMLFACSIAVGQNYYKDRFIIKVKDEYRSKCSNENIDLAPIQSALASMEGAQIKKIFPHHIPQRNKGGEITQKVDLSLVYQFTYTGGKDPSEVISFLKKFEYFEYVEVRYINKLLYTPDDPSIASQWHLATVKAFEAWDTEMGDTSVVIGITDTGYDLDHPDLQDAIAYNYDDPIDGSDNDGDGKIDNYYGWDTGDDDNDPSVSGNSHGVMVAGVAGAVTDNTNQIAGSGFKCRLLPIKIIDASNNLSGDYEGIVYAADQGCDIINASWGSAGASSSFGQDVITYASIDKRSLVVCAAGNDNDEGVFYPASYEWALSVGGTEEDDSKWINNGSTGSNYNQYVDIVAPAVNIFTITNGGSTIASRWGTSFAAPLVAGAAAIVKSQNPTFWGIQVAEQLKATADIVDTMAINSSYQDKMGEGRLNMETSVTDYTNPGFVFTELAHADNNDGRYILGDTIDVTGEFYNFLSASSPTASATIIAHNSNTSVVSGSISLANMATFAGFNINGSPIQIEVTGNPTSNEVAGFTIVMEDGDYNTHHYFELTLNTDYLTYQANNVKTTLTKSGKIGFNDSPQNKQGVGLSGATNSNWLFQMSAIAGNASNAVSFGLDGEFQNAQDFVLSKPGLVSDYDAHVSFDDQPSSSPLGIEVDQTVYAWNDNAEVNDWIMIEYLIKNTSGGDINNLFYGVYADWDISAYQQNNAAYDSTHQLAYAYHASAGYAGIHLVDTNYAFQHYAFENAGTNGSIRVYEEFSEAEQFTSMSSGNGRNASIAEADVSHTLAAEIGTLASGDSVRLTFVVHTGANLADLQSQTIAADSVYNAIHSVALSAHGSNPSCFQLCDGSVKVSPSNGVAPYRYSWIGEPAYDSDSISGLCASTYQIAVIDTLGNQDTVEYILTEPAALSSSFSDTVHDAGGCAGSIQVNVSGGIAPYLYNWTNGSDSAIAVDLCQGEHIVVVTDSNGCVKNDTIDIELITNTDDVVSSGIRAFPNPNNGQFMLSVANAQSQKVEIYSAAGSLVQRFVIQSSMEQIDLSQFGKGLYFLRIEGVEHTVFQIVVR